MTDASVHVIVVMGVAGAGKTTVGTALARALGWTFLDADAFHPAANIEKMSHGIALTDADREPWLDALCTLISNTVHRGEHVVLACSALKQWYREYLVPRDVSHAAVRFIHLDVPVAELRRRLETRKHYFKPELLESQLQTLETPSDAIIVDGTRPVDEIVDHIRTTLNL